MLDVRTLTPTHTRPQAHTETATDSTGGRHVATRPSAGQRLHQRARHALDLRQQLNPEPPPRVVLSYGLGVDSTSILLRYLTEPASRNFALDELVVITAMTGDEWADTGRDVEQHVLPLLRRHGVRYVQVARAQLLTTKAGDGIVVLDDSRHPERVHLAGAYRLSDELTAAGTIPQSGGDRRCSLRAKGAVLDPVIAALAATCGAEEDVVDEVRRILRPASSTPTRSAAPPAPCSPRRGTGSCTSTSHD